MSPLNDTESGKLHSKPFPIFFLFGCPCPCLNLLKCELALLWPLTITVGTVVSLHVSGDISTLFWAGARWRKMLIFLRNSDDNFECASDDVQFRFSKDEQLAVVSCQKSILTWKSRPFSSPISYYISPMATWFLCSFYFGIYFWNIDFQNWIADLKFQMVDFEICRHLTCNDIHFHAGNDYGK